MLIFNLSFGTIAFAQTRDDKDAQHERDVQIFVNRFGTDNQWPVKVDLKNDKKSVGGYISHINDDTFVVTNKRTKVSTTIEYRNVKNISRDRGHTLLIVGLVTIGVLIGGGLICLAAGACVD